MNRIPKTKQRRQFLFFYLEGSSTLTIENLLFASLSLVVYRSKRTDCIAEQMFGSLLKLCSYRLIDLTMLNIIQVFFAGIQLNPFSVHFKFHQPSIIRFDSSVSMAFTEDKISFLPFVEFYYILSLIPFVSQVDQLYAQVANTHSQMCKPIAAFN